MVILLRYRDNDVFCFYITSYVPFEKKPMNNDLVPAINFHLWKYCNFKCKFCFATYEDESELYNLKSHLSENEMLKIIDEISEQKITKITFAGGEPMLCKWLTNLIKYSKAKGLTTMIVTNGYLLNEKWLQNLNGTLDWITLSIDTIDSKNQIKIGRETKGKYISENDFLEKVKLIKNHNIRFKLNTVVNSVNRNENLIEFVKKIKPERWKIFQVLPIEGQNDLYINQLLISKLEYDNYLKRHKEVEKYGIEIVAEDNDLMTGSYLMIDPQGRLYDNVNGKYNYSQSILEIGFNKAREQISLNKRKFVERKGLYEWS